MKKTVRKWFWVWDFDKEEAWLNKMAEQGLTLCNVGFCKYTFEEGAPVSYIIRLEMLKMYWRRAESVKYINFIEETGAEYIGSVLGWAYFRKKTGGEGFDLYSDIDSRIKHLDRILCLIVFFFAILQPLPLPPPTTWDGYPNYFAYVVDLLLCGLLGYGFVRLFNKRRKLKKEKILYE